MTQARPESFDILRRARPTKQFTRFLAGLTGELPEKSDIEVRRFGGEFTRSQPAAHLLKWKEVSNEMGKLPHGWNLQGVLREVGEAVPGLTLQRAIRLGNPVRARRIVNDSPSLSEEYLIATPIRPDKNRRGRNLIDDVLLNERAQLRNSFEEIYHFLGIQSTSVWLKNPVDVTLAYVPPQVSRTEADDFFDTFQAALERESLTVVFEPAQATRVGYNF